MYEEEELRQMSTDELRAIIRDIEKSLSIEPLRGRRREMLIDDILEFVEERGGSASHLR
jgi:hypothetical protein